MCGITVYFNKEGISRENLREALCALEAIRHRGPDGEGVTLINTTTGKAVRLFTNETPEGTPEAIRLEDYKDGDAHLFLGHRRLSIFDLSIAGHQPMHDEAGNWITFNGEIYNFIEIKEELTAKGHQFQTRTDTEVLLAAYREWGENCLQKLNGMWSFALWDGKQKKLFISNDRFGVKGIYIHQNEKEFIAASEIKSIIQFKGRKGPYHEENIHYFLEAGFLDFDNTTFFKNITRFPPAHFGFITPLRGTRVEMKKYWNQNASQNLRLEDSEWIKKFREIFFSSVKFRMRSDAPWGISLSGGIDSSSVACAGTSLFNKSPDLSKNMNSFSCIFPGKEGDESDYIRIMEKHTGLYTHHVEPLQLFSPEEFSKHIWHQDFPVASTSMFAEWCLMKLTASRKVKVLLSGQGGDELFGGYHLHFYKYLRQLLLRLKFKKYKSELKEWAEQKQIPLTKMKGIMRGEMKQHIRYKFVKNHTNPEQARLAAGNLESILNIDFHQLMLPTNLRSEDRDSMAFGVETRVPFLDYRMVEFAAQVPSDLKIRNGWQKWIVREGMTELPNEIRWRKDKKGYSNPQKEWIRSKAEYFIENLGSLAHIGIKQDKDEVRTSLFSNSNEHAFRLATLGIWAEQTSKF